MFYSHQILARKGPLATVWIAAHLQHRLKKSHYTATDIPKTVDRIMFPEAPIALRMSSHLLLGVVRIYSKKVDYLHHDCNVILIGISKAFSYKEINLPETAANAPPEAVTLPERFQLDALDLDDGLNQYEGEQDRFRRSLDEITLPDNVPAESDFYVAITFDEDILTVQSPLKSPHPDDRISGQEPFPQIQVDGSVVSRNPVQTDQMEIASALYNGVTDSDVRPMEEDIIPPVSVDTSGGFHPPSPSNQRINKEHSPQSYPDIEVMRDAVHDLRTKNFPAWPDFQNALTEAQVPADQVATEKEIPSPLLENILISGGQSSPFRKHLNGPTSINSAEAPDIFETRISFGRASLDLALRSTPPVKQPKTRARKKKLLIDETIVLTNQFMKKALSDAHDLSRKRKLCPGSLLGDWKLRNRQKSELILDEPSVTCICTDLCNIFKKDYIIAKPHLVILKEASSGPRASRSPASVPDFDIEVENLRAADSPGHLPDIDRENDRLRAAQSPVRIPDLDIDMENERLRSANSQTAVAEHDLESELFKRCQSPAAVAELDMEIERLRRAQSPAAVAELDMEIECLRQADGTAGSNVLPEFMPSPMGSPFRKDFTPANLGSDHQGGTTVGTGVFSTSSVASTFHFGSEMETPNTYGEEQIGVENTGLYDIPELMNSAETEDLNFLEADNSPTSFQGTKNADTLSVRTRAVAQFLKAQSPAAEIRENLTDDLSLNKILEGKSRKLCARMFYETLVLKSYGLIDVHQEEPYGDIELKLAPSLKAQF